MKLTLVFILSCFIVPVSSQETSLSKKTYCFSNEPIDVIIPACPKDLITLEDSIAGIIENCEGVRRIIVISKEKITDSAEWYDEACYPFSKLDVAIALKQDNIEEGRAFLNSPKSRVGWYFQQLLKLYAPYVIPNLSKNVLIVDSDTVFLNRVSFLNEFGGGVYNTSVEYHYEYFNHARRLLPGFKKIYPEYSGIVHHMLFQKEILDDLFLDVESYHCEEFWSAFCHSVNPDYLKSDSSGASEYELYFNYSLAKTNQVKLRHLKWDNIPFVEDIEYYRSCGYDYVSCHEWLREYYLPFKH